MMDVEIRPANLLDTLGLLGRTQFIGVKGAEESLRQHMFMSENSWIGKVDGVAMVAWGVIAPCVLSSSAYVWVIVADEIKKDPKYRFLFTRYSQRILDILLEKHESLIGFCYPHQEESIKWIKFLGGEFREPDEQNRISFKIRRKPDAIRA